MKLLSPSQFFAPKKIAKSSIAIIVQSQKPSGQTPFRENIALDQGFPLFLWPCTPLAFRQMSMYPFSISKD